MATSSVRDKQLMGAVDARTIVPVRDAHGGVTVYDQGRPIRYLLGGEWYRAVPDPGPAVTRSVASR